MTDRQRQLIEAYLPSPRDEDLDFDEYYVMNTAERVVKCRVTDIMPCLDRTTYGVVDMAGRRIDAGYGTPYIGFSKSNLYDNKEDCRNSTHFMYDGWEELREIQKNEKEAMREND